MGLFGVSRLYTFGPEVVTERHTGTRSVHGRDQESKGRVFTLVDLRVGEVSV